MSFGTVAAIGMEMIKHRQEIGTTLSNVSSLGKLAGKNFSQIAERFQLSKALGQKIDNALQDIKNPQASQGMPLLASMRYFDTDQNGSLTKTELSQGLKAMRDAGINDQPGKTAQLYKRGEMLLKQYDQTAQQDGSASEISYQDVGKLLSEK